MNIEVMPAVITVIRPIDTSRRDESADIRHRRVVAEADGGHHLECEPERIAEHGVPVVGQQPDQSAPARTSVMMVLMIAAAADRIDDDLFLQQVRRFAADLPNTGEKVSHERPAFFTKKVFAYYGDSLKVDGEWVEHLRAIMQHPVWMIRMWATPI